MKKDNVDLLINILKTEQSISTADLAKMMDVTKRRIFDVLPVLEVLGLIDRTKKGIITWIEPVVPELPVQENTYNADKLIISCIGVITSVKNLGAQQMMIEQTARGFTIEPVMDGT